MRLPLMTGRSCKEYHRKMWGNVGAFWSDISIGHKACLVSPKEDSIPWVYLISPGNDVNIHVSPGKVHTSLYPSIHYDIVFYLLHVFETFFVWWLYYSSRILKNQLLSSRHLSITTHANPSYPPLWKYHSLKCNGAQSRVSTYLIMNH